MKIIVKKPWEPKKFNDGPLFFNIVHREAASWVIEQLMTNHITDSSELFQKSPYSMPEVGDAIHGLKRQGYIKTDYLMDKGGGRFEEWTLCPEPASKLPEFDNQQEIVFIRFASRKGINIVAADPNLSLTDKGLFTYMWNVSAEQDKVTKGDVCYAHADADEGDFETSLESLQCEGYLKIETTEILSNGAKVKTWILNQEPKNHHRGE